MTNNISIIAEALCRNIMGITCQVSRTTSYAELPCDSHPPSVTYVACLMTRDFSRRYSEILAPMTAPVGVNFISRYFPKRLELSLMAVVAFPNASTRLLTSRIFSCSSRLLA